MRSNTNHPSPSAAGFMRLEQILQLFPVSKSQWWKGVKDGQYPAPVKLGPKMTAWPTSQIYKLLESFNSPKK